MSSPIEIPFVWPDSRKLAGKALFLPWDDADSNKIYLCMLYFDAERFADAHGLFLQSLL